MRYVILLALLAAVSCAPLENEAIRVRRAQEIVMFGNEQNEATKDKVKRSEDETSEEADMNGSIVSQEPKELDPELDAQNEEEAIGNVGDIPEEVSEDSTDDTEPDTLAPEEDAPNSEEIEMSQSQPDESAEIVDGENFDEDADAAFQKFNGDILPAYYYDLLASKQRPSLGYYDLYPNFLRKRRSQERIFLGDKARRARILKRSRRIKRDLIYPSESLGRDYLYGDEYPESSDNYNDFVGYLLDLLDEKFNEEPAEYNYGYDEPVELEPYEELEDPREELVYPGYEERLENAIAKRQAGLTFVPGFKRNFYPYFEEPLSHFQAFVPEKRSQEEYADAYRRVMGLASALGQNDYYTGSYRYPEYDFRRK